MITGVDHLTSGEVIVNASGSPVSIHKMSEDEIALWRGHNSVLYSSHSNFYPCLRSLKTLPCLWIFVARSSQNNP